MIITTSHNDMHLKAVKNEIADSLAASDRKDPPTVTVIGGAVNELTYMSDRKGHGGITKDGTATTLTSQEKERLMITTKEMDDAIARNQVLRLLRETYGTETVFQWGTAIMDRLQQTEILRQGVHESSIPAETENREKLVNDSQICTAKETERIVRNLRKYEECGCTSYGRQSAEQLSAELAEVMQKLPLKSAQASATLLDMWRKSERLGLLQSALHSLQEIRRSVMGERAEGGDVMTSVVRRLTPLE